MDVTIVLQGRLHLNGWGCINKYKKFGKVIVSCWEDDLNPHSAEDIKIIRSKYPRNQFYNSSNFYYQCYSSLAGLLAVDTPFVIKVRSDEYYEDLNILLEKMSRQPHKMITNNVFFRIDSERKFHVSDHLIAGSTRDMIRTFQIASLLCTTNHKFISGDQFGTKLGRLVPEQIICCSFLKGKNIPINTDRSKQIMMQNFDVVKVQDFGKFIVSCNSCRDREISDPDLLKSYYRSIESMGEL
jgi:hypothetical protein